MLRITKINPEKAGQMSVGPCIILAMFKSYWYVCTNCDASIEVVSQGLHYQDPTCNCSNSQVVWRQTSVVESGPTNERQQMETTIAETYNPNLLITYKKIENGETSYATDKVTDIEYQLELGRRNYKTLTEKQNAWYTKESQLRNLLQDVYVDSSDQETLAQIAEIFDISLTKEVEYTAWLRVDMTVEVDMTSDTDSIEDFIAQNLTVDSYGSEISVNDFDVERVEEGAY